MKVRRTVLILLCLLAVAGAWFFWPRSGRRVAGENNSAATASVAVVKNNFSTAPPASTKSPVVADSGKLSAAGTNRLTFRLANTPKSIAELKGERHAILLENAFIDTTAQLNLKIPSHLQSSGEPGAFIVQARGAIDGAFRAALAGAGGKIISYIPNNAFLVEISSAGAAALSASALVQAVLPYEPYYKVQASLLGLAVNQKPLPPGTFLTLGLFDDSAAATIAQIESLGGKVLSQDRSPFGQIVHISPPADWIALANLPGVERVEPSHLRKVANDLSRVAMGVSVNAVTNVNWLNLSGTNVLVEVNDSGIDANHRDFSVIGSASAPGMVPPSRVTGDTTNSLYDTDGHGTHVAGIIAGNGSMSLTVTSARGSVTNADFRGKAPAAKLFSVGFLGANDTNEDAFVDDSYLQETPALTNALISNNSWVNDGDNEYDLSAASYDAAVRDALPEVTGPQPVLFVFAAGNDGGGLSDGSSSGSADTIESPGTAKNVITVGALEQFRNITNGVTPLGSTNASPIWAPETDSSFQVADYSARGNVGVETEGLFGRFKPDVVAPGTFVISTRSTVWDQLAYYNPTNYHDETLTGQLVTSNTYAYGGITVPQNAVGVIIQIQNEVPPNINLPIYVSRTGVPDPTDPTTYDFATSNNIVSIPPDPNNTGAAYLATILNGGVSFTVGDGTNIPVTFDVLEEVITTNDLGNQLEVLSNLNNTIGPYYRYETGTSMSAASISGVLALMQDFFTNTLHLTPSPALLKAMLVNGARVNGNYNFAVANTMNLQGWGLVKLSNSIPLALTNTAAGLTNSPLFFVDQSPTNVVATGDRRTYLVSVPSAASRALPLRVTLAWTDPPGNPAAAIKLVNDLELVVTNIASGKVYYANQFSTSGTPPFSVASATNAPPAYDSINNVQNIYLAPTLGTNYSVTVVGNAVNVNAVTLEQTNIVQDFALVIASGDGNNSNGVSVTATAPSLSSATVPRVTYVTPTNSIYFNQTAGASAPWLSTNSIALGAFTNSPFATNAVFYIGQTNQWHFYVVTNNTATNTYAAFIVFLPNTLAIPREGVFAGSDANSTRPEADLELFAATAPDLNASGLTNLNPLVLSNCLFNVSNADEGSYGRGGTEFVTFSNSTLGQAYYIAVQCDDQTAGQFGFVPLFSSTPFSQQDTNGNIYVNAVNVPNNIPDGNNAHPGVSYVFGLAVPSDPSTTIRNVTVTNTVTHENFGDLLGALSHGSAYAILNNHDGLGPVINDALVYDDSGQGDVPGALHTDGPGSLNNFQGAVAVGPWILNEIDDSPGSTGTVVNLQLCIEPHHDLSKQPFTVVSVPPGGWFYDYVDAPVGYTNLLVVATNLPPTAQPPNPIQLYVKLGSEPTQADTNDMVLLTNCVVGTYPTGVDPGNSESIGPPLVPGRYYIGIFNPDSVAHNVLVGATLSFDSAAETTVDYDSTDTPLPLLDDAVTYDDIFVTNTDLIQGFNVGLRVDHPRISDMVFTLISPDGSRYLLMENRGGQTTNGCGATVITTNIFNASANGNAQPNTNVINVGTTSGIIPITYNFYTAPDEMTIYYGPNVATNYLIYDTGVTNNPSLGGGPQNTLPETINVSYGPTNGLTSTYLTIVMDQFLPTNRSDAWTYSAGSVATNYYYLSFTENTNLTTTPIKFAPPPFVPQTVFSQVMTDSFEIYEVQAYTPLIGFGGWMVLTNQVEIVSNLPAYDGVQYLQIDNGVVVTNLATVPGQQYNLTYALGSTFTEDASTPTNANWLPKNLLFTATSTNTPLVLAASADVLAGLSFTNAQTLIFDTNAVLDDFTLTELPQNLYYQAEQSLSPIVGTSAFGDWQLEALDNRAGATNPAPELLSWQLSFTFANTNFTIPTLTLNNGLIQTNYAPPGSLTWYEIIVPTNAIAATNILYFASLPLNIWFSTNVPPTITNTIAGDTELLPASTGGSVVLYTNTQYAPTNIIQGGTYYLGVQNPNQFTATYAVAVNFELASSSISNGAALPFANSLPATGVTGTNAQLNGFATPNTTNGSPPATAWFQWGATTNYGNVTPSVNVGSGFGVVYVDSSISGLIFAQVYHCRLVVSNSLGLAYGADEEFAPGNVVAWGNNDFGQVTNIPAGLSNVVAVAGGWSNSVALLNNGAVTNWGDDSYGQSSSMPPGLTNVVAITAGGNDVLALLNNGTVVGWGANSGQTNIPVGLSNVVEIAAGWSNGLALLSDGTVTNWGDNTYGQVTGVPPGLSNVVAVASGGNDCLALLNDGTVVGWGANANIPAGLSNVVAITSGASNGLALLADGTVTNWGDNTYGQLNVPVGVNNVEAVAAGFGDSLVLQNNGNLVAWGNDSSGQTNVPSSLTNVFAIACGAYHDLALVPEPPVYPPYANTMPATSVNGTAAQINGFATANGHASIAWFQWGTSTNYANLSSPVANIGSGFGVVYVTNAIAGLIYGQTYHYQVVVSNSVGIAYGFDQLLVAGSTVAWGDNTYGQSTVPVGSSNVVAIAAGGYHSLEILTNGMVLAQGDNANGQATIPANLSSNAVAIAGGLYHSLAVQSNGLVTAWGYSNDGQTNVPTSVSNVVVVAGGGFASLALQNSGLISAWGDNTYGQTNVPAGLSNVVAVAEGGEHSLALLNNGTVVGWGTNTYGEISVPGLNNVVAVAAGNYHSLALQNNGEVVAWGNDTFGQIDVPAAASSNVVAIAAGGYHNLALLNDGSIVVWGDNTSGQTNVPASVSNVVAVAGGAYHSLVLTSPYNINLNLFNYPTNPINNQPQTNVVGAGGINWYQINVPTNAIAATNTLFFATLPVNFWFSTNAPPTITTTNDVELLTNVASGSVTLFTTSSPAFIVPGGIYYLGVQNTNSVPVTNAVQVTFEYAPPMLPFIPDQVVVAGNTLTVTNAATNNIAGDTLVYVLDNPPVGAPPAGPQIDPNGIITWTPSTNIAPTNVVITTIVTDTFTLLSATNSFTVYVLPSLVVSQPQTNVVGSNGITWYQVNVPTNAIAATNTLLFASAPVNLWWSTNVPPSITTTNDIELLTNSINGTNVISISNTVPLLMPGGIYYLGVQNTNSFSVTNAIEVDFDLGNPVLPPVLPVIPDQVIAAGDTLVVTNTATDIYTNDVLVYYLTNSPAGSAIDTNGIITWPTATNMAPTNVVITTIVTDTNTMLNATNSFNVIVLPPLINDQPDTNTVGSNSITWYLIKVPTNAVAATNSLLFATLPVNVWFSTNVPPTITNAYDFELLTNLTVGDSVISTNTTPLLVPGSRYYLGVQNTNAVPVTNAVMVTFLLTTNPPPIFSIFSIVNTNIGGTNGWLITWFAPTNYQFHLQWTSNLLAANWHIFNGVISFLSPNSATNGLFQYFDNGARYYDNGSPVTGSPVDGFDPTRFYRLQLLNSPTNTSPFFLNVLSNTPPVYLDPGVAFTLTNNAADWDFPAQTLTYRVTNSLAGTNGATINTNTGVIIWTPTPAQGGQTNIITTVVTDNGVPAKSTTNSFAVLVNPIPPFSSITINTNGVNLQWSAWTNEQFEVQWATNLLPPVIWTLYPDNITPDIITSTNGTFFFTDTNAPLLMKFYQLILLP